MKLNSPMPQPLSKECAKAARIFKSFVDSGNNGLDGVIPRQVLENARGFAIYTVVKAGFVFSARGGSGIVIARLDDGSWSSPSAIGTAGLGFGGQAGAEVTDVLIVLNTRAALQSFMAAGSLSLGGNMSLAVGPLGRNGEALASVSTKAKVAAMYSYSKTKGLFGGISLEGTVIVERQDANSIAYNNPNVTARLLLSGSIQQPPWAQPLVQTLDACIGFPGGRPWINDGPLGAGDSVASIESNPSARSYAFGGLGSAVKPPAQLKKKKKESFPPQSWGQPTRNGSYFFDENDFQENRSHPPPVSTARNTTSGFDMQFESDFSAQPDARPSHKNSRSLPANTTTSQKDWFDDLDSQGLTDSPSAMSHSRSKSLAASTWSGYSTANNDDNPFDDEAPRSYIASKPELSKPLSEGLARAIALFDFHAVEAGDLSFNKGDVITIIKMSDSTDDWWTGQSKGREGIFPANFVEVV